MYHIAASKQTWEHNIDIKLLCHTYCETSSVDWAQLSRVYLKTVFLDRDRMMDNVQKHNICIIPFKFPFIIKYVKIIHSI
jgi:hypothetical protein